jgi:hypothetical protein
MSKKLNTIKVSGGGDYAKVAERLKEFHKTYSNGKIETSYNLTEAMICFKTIITPDVEKPERFFTGHSLGKIAGVKAFEKLETISAGRALAFLGLLADGEIASADEMEEYIEETNSKEADRLETIEELKKVADKITSVEELRKFYAINKGMGKEFDQYITSLSKKLKA